MCPDSCLVRGLSLDMRSLKKSNVVNLIMKLPIFLMCIWEKLPFACVTYRICMTGQAICSQITAGLSLCVEHSVSYSQQ